MANRPAADAYCEARLTPARAPRNMPAGREKGHSLRLVHDASTGAHRVPYSAVFIGEATEGNPAQTCPA